MLRWHDGNCADAARRSNTSSPEADLEALLRGIDPIGAPPDDPSLPELSDGSLTSFPGPVLRPAASEDVDTRSPQHSRARSTSRLSSSSTISEADTNDSVQVSLCSIPGCTGCRRPVFAP